ncbi:MAG TPA: MFS transporter [Ktedonobacterales bacterium]
MAKMDADVDADAGIGAGAGKREAGLRALWRNANYLLLWGGQAVSSVGTQLSQIAYPLLVLALTGSAAQAGLLGAARTVPYLLLGLPAGALVDRWNRKRLMMICDAGRAVLLGSIPLALLFGRLTLAQLYVVALAEGMLNVFFNLANTAALTRVVTKAQLPTALAQDEVTLSAGFTAGPALGGALFGLGRALPFLADAISYAASVLSLRLIRADLNEPRTEGAARGWAALRDEIGEGMRWLWGHPLVRFLALVVGGGQLVESGCILVVIVAAQRMGASDAMVGLVLALGGVGSIIGGALAAPIARRASFGRITLAVHWIWAAALPLYAIAPNPLALGAITAVTFGVTEVFLIAQYTYRLTLIPDALLGRVNSVVRLALYAGSPLGVALAGVLLQVWGAGAAALILAGLLGFVALAATLYAPMRTAPKLSAHED